MKLPAGDSIGMACTSMGAGIWPFFQYARWLKGTWWVAPFCAVKSSRLWTALMATTSPGVLSIWSVCSGWPPPVSMLMPFKVPRVHSGPRISRTRERRRGRAASRRKVADFPCRAKLTS